MKILSKTKFNKIKTIDNENTILLPHEYFEIFTNIYGHQNCPICRLNIFYKPIIDIELFGNKLVLNNMTCYTCNFVLRMYMYIDFITFKIHKTISI